MAKSNNEQDDAVQIMQVQLTDFFRRKGVLSGDDDQTFEEYVEGLSPEDIEAMRHDPDLLYPPTPEEIEELKLTTKESLIKRIMNLIRETPPEE